MTTGRYLSGIHDFIRSSNGGMEILARILIAVLIIGATIFMIMLERPIPDAWWAMATAVTAYLFQPQVKEIEARRRPTTSPDSEEN